MPKNELLRLSSCLAVCLAFSIQDSAKGQVGMRYAENADNYVVPGAEFVATPEFAMRRTGYTIRGNRRAGPLLVEGREVYYAPGENPWQDCDGFACRGMPGDMSPCLQLKAYQSELKLTPAQATAVSELFTTREEMLYQRLIAGEPGAVKRPGLQADLDEVLRETRVFVDSELRRILTPGQLSRLTQLEAQLDLRTRGLPSLREIMTDDQLGLLQQADLAIRSTVRGEKNKLKVGRPAREIQLIHGVLTEVQQERLRRQLGEVIQDDVLMYPDNALTGPYKIYRDHWFVFVKKLVTEAEWEKCERFALDVNEEYAALVLPQRPRPQQLAVGATPEERRVAAEKYGAALKEYEREARDYEARFAALRSSGARMHEAVGRVCCQKITRGFAQRSMHYRPIQSLLGARKPTYDGGNPNPLYLDLSEVQRKQLRAGQGRLHREDNLFLINRTNALQDGALAKLLTDLQHAKVKTIMGPRLHPTMDVLSESPWSVR